MRRPEARAERGIECARAFHDLARRRSRDLLHRAVRGGAERRAGDDLAREEERDHLGPAQRDREPAPISLDDAPPRVPAAALLVDGHPDALEHLEVAVDGPPGAEELLC